MTQPILHLLSDNFNQYHSLTLGEVRLIVRNDSMMRCQVYKSSDDKTIHVTVFTR